MTRTLEDEFCALGGASDIADAVTALGILPDATHFSRLEILKDWYRSGAETYLAICRIQSHHRAPIDVAVKACIAITERMSVEATLKAWLRRRAHVSRNEVSTPQLFGHGDGILIEEYIPYGLSEAIDRSHDIAPFATAAVKVAAALARLGYQPTSLFGDLRSRGSDVVLVDFGADLGPAIPNQYDHTSLRSELLDFLVSISYASPDAALRDFDEEAKQF